MYRSTDHTFVVCAYGDSPYLRDCLASLRDQSCETNVLLATSTPSSHISRICEEFGVALNVNPGPGGIAGDWNYAVSLTNTPLVTIAHQDDVYLPSYAQEMISAASEHPNPTLLFCDYGELRGNRRVDKNQLLSVKRLLLTPMRSKLLARSRFAKRRCLSLGCPICCPSVTLVRTVFDEPLFEATYGSDLDWQAWEKLANAVGSFVYVPRILMLHRIHADSETSHLIENSQRTQEDLSMLSHFWPMPMARAINRLYRRGQRSNTV